MNFFLKMLWKHDVIPWLLGIILVPHSSIPPSQVALATLVAPGTPRLTSSLRILSSCSRKRAWPKPALVAIDPKTMGIATARAQNVAILRRFHRRIIRMTILAVEFKHWHLRFQNVSEVQQVQYSCTTKHLMLHGQNRTSSL